MTTLENMSPQPWDAGDKLAIVYDANATPIATFGDGGKECRDLENRNRTVQCVNACMGLEDPYGFISIARRVAQGEIAPTVLQSIMEEASAFTVEGPAPEGGRVRLDPCSYSDARYHKALYSEWGTGGLQIIHLPTETIL